MYNLPGVKIMPELGATVYLFFGRAGQTRSNQSGGNTAVASNLTDESENYKDKVDVENI